MTSVHEIRRANAKNIRTVVVTAAKTNDRVGYTLPRPRDLKLVFWCRKQPIVIAAEYDTPCYHPSFENRDGASYTLGGLPDSSALTCM
jgi:hypothetical protein